MARNAGRLDRLVTIQKPTESVEDVYGQPTTTYTTLTKVWAQIVESTGNEADVQQRTGSRRAAEFILRWRGDITTQHRIVHDGNTWEITAPPIERGRCERLSIFAEVLD